MIKIIGGFCTSLSIRFPANVSMLFQRCLLVGWYDVAMWDNVKSTSKQCVSQRLNLHRRINVAYFSIDVKNVTQRRNNVAHFNVEFYNVDQRGNNVVKTTISNKKKNDDDELFLRNGWPTKGVYALSPAGTIVRYSHHRKSPTRRKQGFKLRRIWVQTLLNEAVQ